MLNAAILTSIVAVAGLLLWPRLSNAPLWRATVTPLASIIGSGFLVLGPILDVSFGTFAPLAMALLCVVAFGFGAAIRFNIEDIYRRPDRGRLLEGMERFASGTLAFAFVVSVAYYLNLFGAFGVSLTALDDAHHARLLTTGIFVLILIVGWTRGFSALERMEQVAVGLKLAIIAGLIVGLAAYFGEQAAVGNLNVDPPKTTGWAAATLLAGLLVTVQGFETARYLGGTYSAALRIRAMRLAQYISGGIYLIYIGLLTFAFDPGSLALDETAVIDLTIVVAPIVPALLVVAALSAQFSAAVADTSGSGGLIEELSGGRIREKHAYALLVGIGLALTWTADVFEIISYASRAFAAYYAAQAAIATVAATRSGHTSHSALFCALTILAALTAAFGKPVE